MKTMQAFKGVLPNVFVNSLARHDQHLCHGCVHSFHTELYSNGFQHIWLCPDCQSDKKKMKVLEKADYRRSYKKG